MNGDIEEATRHLEETVIPQFAKVMGEKEERECDRERERERER